MIGTDDRSVLDNIGLVFTVLRRLRLPRTWRNLIDREDLVQWGMLGLVMADRTFDPSRGFAFSTHACQSIYHACLRGITLQVREKTSNSDATRAREYDDRRRLPIADYLCYTDENADPSEIASVREQAAAFEAALDSLPGQLELAARARLRGALYREIGAGVGRGRETGRKLAHAAVEALGQVVRGRLCPDALARGFRAVAGSAALCLVVLGACGSTRPTLPEVLAGSRDVSAEQLLGAAVRALSAPGAATAGEWKRSDTVRVLSSTCWGSHRGLWPHAVVRSLPTLGSVYLVEFATHGLPDEPPQPPRPAWVLFGVSAPEWAGRSLPADLGRDGMPGCRLLFAPLFAQWLPADQASELGWLHRAAGARTIDLLFPIPSDPTLSGRTWWFQLATYDRRGNAAGLLLSAAHQVVLGFDPREPR